MSFLKEISSVVSIPLNIIFRHSILTGEILEFWKFSIVVPLPKQLPHNIVQNFRPVSITCFPGRVMEKIIVKYMIEFSKANSLIPKEQRGFLSGRSRETTMLQCLNDWTFAIDRRKQIDIVYFDFAKAFDRVSHTKLIYKLQLMGFPNYICTWIKNWISNRKFVVKYDSSLSDIHEVSSGVPQGSVLGPCLFNLYTADLATELRKLKVSFQMYADDIKIYGIFDMHDDRTPIQSAIDCVSRWSQKWQLPLAPKKCNALYLGKYNPKADYILENVMIQKVKEVKDLGFIITNNLKFSKHIRIITNSAKRRAFLIFKAMKTRKMKVLLTAYTMYVRSILESGSTVFNPYSKKDINMLENVQAMFTKRLFMRCKLMKYNETPNRVVRKRELGLDSLALRRSKADMKLMLGILKGSVEVLPTDFYTFKATRTRGGTYKIKVPRARTNVRKYSFSCRTSYNYSIVQNNRNSRNTQNI